MERAYSLLQNQEISQSQFLAEKLISELAQRNMTICVAEGCTGGSLLNNLTVPGSVRAFHIGVVSYSLQSKLALGVPKKTIDTFGEYSPEVAIAMAEAIQKKRNDTLAIASVGDIDPPDKTSPRLVFIGYSMLGKPSLVQTLLLPSNSRKNNKTQLTEMCLSNALMFIQEKHNMSGEKHLLLPINNRAGEEVNKASLIVNLLRQKKLTISTMESCTGGAIADALTDISGASQVFHSSLIAYDENVKIMFGVPLPSMAYGGVYSKKVAYEMANAVMQRTGTDIAIATTGTMDNIDTRPFHADSQPGTVYMAILIRHQKPLVLQLKINPTPREQMKSEVVNKAFDLLIDKLASQEEYSPIDNYQDYKLLSLY